MLNIKLIGEIGINHNGSVKIAKDLIDIAKLSGFDFVKIQKRNPDIAVPENQKNKEKIVPWREKPTTYLQYKKDIELSLFQINSLFNYSKQKEIDLFSSVWDCESALELKNNTNMNIIKIPSAKLTDWELLKLCNELYNFTILSTGMSTEDEIEKAVKILNPDVIMHTNSVYPTPVTDLRLLYIQWLKEKYPKKEIGYSSHYFGIKDLFFAVGLGATWLEKHITLNHNMWGSDQSASVEPNGIFQIGKAIRDMEQCWNGYEKRSIYPGEEKKRESLRGN
jgi:N-acetylneuraminate synthase